MKYKKTGIDWMPEVPEHWILKRGNWIFTLGKDIVTKEQLQSVKSLLHYSIPSIQETGKPSLERGNTIDSNKQIVGAGDLLVSKLNPRKKTIVVVEHDEDNRLLVASTEFVNLKCTDANTRFTYYLYLSHVVTERIASTVQSSTNSHQRAYPDTIFKMWNYFPPIEEQKAIADFLDAKSSQITRFIQNKQRFIKFLKEQRQSIITNAVTKGIDGGAKMKETVLGEVPEHWEVRRLGTIGRFSKGGNISRSELVYTGDGVPAILYGDIYTKYDIVAEDIINRISKVTAANSVELKKGELLFTGSGETVEDIGKCVVFSSKEPAYAGGDVIIFKQDIFDSHFISYSQNSSIAKHQKAISSKGEIIVHTYGSKLRDVTMPYPPTIEEQMQIVEHIKKETRNLDVAINKAEREIELIKEYREAMIAEAVTGKIKIVNE